MKKREFIKIVCVLFVSLFVFSNKVAASNTINSISMDIYIDKTGNAHVTEKWRANLTEGSEGYKPYYNLGTSEIKDFQVMMENQKFTSLANWDVEASFYDKKYKNGINYNGSATELCWGISDYGSHTYTLTYTITNFVSALNDTDMAYWTLIPYELSSKPGQVDIKIYTDEPFADTLDVWGFGNYGGLAYVDDTDGAIYMSSEGTLESNEYMTILVKFPKGIFEPQNKIEANFDYYLNMANEDSKKYETPFREKVLNFIILLIPFLIFGVVFVVVIIELVKNAGCKTIGGRKIYFGKRANLPTEPKYFRDIPVDKNINKAYWLATAYNLRKNETDVLGAYLLDWINKDYITIEKVVKDGMFKSKEEQHLILKPSKDLPLEGVSLRLYDMLISASKDGVLEPREFDNWCSKNYTKIFDWFDDVLNEAYNEWSGEGRFPETTYKKWWMTIKNKTIDDYLYEQATYLKGLKNFLNDFSNIKDREAIEVKLWQEYLVFAQIFGIAKKVAQEFKRLYPDVIPDTSYGTILFVHSMSRHSMASAQSARSKAESYSSGGGGFSAGGGGGGSFGGGGGGGGFR